MAAKRRKKAAKARRTTVVAVGRKRRKRTTSAPMHRRRRSVGAVGAIGATRHRPRRRKKSGMLGATGSNLKQIAIMAVGVAAGAGITHVILRPVEMRLAEKWPMIGKFLAAGEVFLGGVIALKGKSNFTKSLGVGILAGGVHGLMKQANIYKNIPGIHGPDGYSEVRVPISGSLDSMINGILEDGRRNVRTSVVAGTNRTSIIADTEQDRTSIVAGDLEDNSEYYVKGGW